MKSGYVDGPWGQIHYRSSGIRGPWVVLFHESPLSSVVWEKVMSHLGDGVRVIAFDTPGYGASNAPAGPDTEIPEYAAVLAAATLDLGVTDPVFCGLHTGASIAIEAARLFGERCPGVVLSGVALYDAEERAEHLANWAPDVEKTMHGDQFSWAVERYRRIWPGLDEEMLHLASLEALRVLPRYHWGYRAAFRHDPAESLAALDVPVLLLDAEFDLLADKDAVALATAKDARLVVLPGLHGQPHLRAPAEYAQHLRTFVDKVAR
ncbi:alpha/beta fold hydrolase [Nocardioides yefusunii]|uniref:Alpha/beta fold hydrolase n=1 Tax=Nocardioides yefusunii TaxID=2500546 RepID=A0ABW1QRM1_9ACTN|nr:alpha/beta hydrolase [Nocardioides yefusunii]